MISRRHLLRGAGGVGVALPFLDAMAASSTRRRSARFPKRFVVFFSANGTIHKNWRPRGDQENFTFASPEDAPGTRSLAPLEEWKSKLLVLDGIAAKSRKLGPGGNGHDKGMGHMLTAAKLVVGPSGVGEFSHLPDGTSGGISIDQEVARRIGGSTRLGSLEFGVRSRLDTKRQLTSRMCYRGPFQVVPPENDPAELFRNVFVGVGAESGSKLLAGLRAERRSVLDRVMADFKALDRQLGAEDRQRLQAHVGGVREIERSLTVEGTRKQTCRAPDDVPTIDQWDNDNYPQVGKLQMDLLVTALACDLTRVCSLQWSTAQSGVTFTWLGHSEDHHGLSHQADDTEEARRQLTAIDHWYAQRFAYLLKRMSEIREGDGTMLDNSVVLWSNEQGNGDKHTLTEIPYIIAGSGGGYLRTGRYLKFADEPAHNDLFVSMLHATGCEDVKSFGAPEVCKGPLPGLT